jgi:hypothetical protein
VPSLVTPPFFIKYYDASWNHTQGVDEPLGTILATVIFLTVTDKDRTERHQPTAIDPQASSTAGSQS